MLDRTQQILLKLLKEIDELCWKNDIHYALGGGTAIGAVRHLGFIPWDDDIDLYMTRENWEKFKALYAAGKFPDNRVLESAEIDTGYSNTFGRYVTTDSAAVHTHQIAYDDPAGHVIDIFVFDPLMKRDMNRFLEDYMLSCDLINLNMGYSTRFDMNIDRYPRYYERACKEGLRDEIDELTESLASLGNDGHDSYAMEWGSAPMLFSASIFDQGYIRVPYEDTEVETVKAYSEYLTLQFGDEWVYIPWHEGREGHDAIYSEKISYQTIREDYRCCMDVDALRKSLVRRKMSLLKTNPLRHQAEDIKACTQAARAAVETELIIRVNNVDIDELLKRGDYWELDKVFGRFYEIQLGADVIGRLDRHSKQYRYFNPVLVPVRGNTMSAAVETLMRTERMSKAARLAEIYIEQDGRDAKVAELYEEIKAVRNIINRYSMLDELDEVDKDRWQQDFEDALLKYPRSSQLKRLKIRLLLESAAGRSIRKKNAILAEASELTSEQEQFWTLGTLAHGEICKYRADMEIIKGDVESAKVHYIYAYEHTTNGITRAEIEKLAEIYNFEIKETDTAWLELKDREMYRVNVTPGAVNRRARSMGASQTKLKFMKLRIKRYNLKSKKDDAAKDRAISIMRRTGDRVKLLEMYEDRLDELEKLEASGSWDRLEEEMRPHREALERNLGLGLGLSVHPILTRIQNELLEREGKGELAKKNDKLVPDEHRKPIGEK